MPKPVRALLILLLLMLSLTLLVPGHPVQSGDPPAFIRLGVYVFDPLEAEPRLPPELQIRAGDVEGEGYYIVQFYDPVFQTSKDALIAAGGEILDYVPDNAFLVRMYPASLPVVRKIDAIRWIGAYQPAYKLAPELLLEGNERQVVFITLFAGQDTAHFVANLLPLGADVLETSEGSWQNRVRADLLTDAIVTVAHSPSVYSIEPWVEPEVANDVARTIMDVDLTWTDHHLYGEGQTVAVCDTGLDIGVNDQTLSADFRGRVAAAHALGRTGDWSDGLDPAPGSNPSGHGTHVAGSVLGNGSLSGADPQAHNYAASHAGVAPEAQLVIQSVMDANGGLGGIPADLNTLFQQAWNDGARIHNNSWGAPVNGDYTTRSRDLDQFVWDHPEMAILVAAGNEAVDADSNGVVDLDSMDSPGTAKNCITVGATENLRATGGFNPGGLCDTWGTCWPDDFGADPVRGDRLSNNQSGLAAFSSRGPTDQNRIKPDVVAPGTNIISARSHDVGATTGWGIHDANYLFMGGTSMATPLTAGAVTLIREYYTDRCYSPSAALLKATLINGAEEIQPGQYGTGTTQEISSPRPNNVEGWGRVNLEGSIFPASPTTWSFVDETVGLQTSASWTARYRVRNSSVPLKVTLVWSDFPGPNLVNHLDLTVTSPDGTVHHPNGLAAADTVNNVEVVELPSPATGMYTVSVDAPNIPLGPQPFALVLSGGDLQPAFDVISPAYPEVAYAGPHNAPTKLVIKATKAVDGLSRSDFSVQIGGQSATLLTVYEGTDSYILEVTPPAQSANGVYELVVSAASATHREPCVIRYADVNNVDVDLVIDRSGSMSSDNKMEMAKDAAQLFVDRMQTNDMIGVVSFDDIIETNFPLTVISSEAVQTQAKNAIELLSARGLTSIGGGLERGQQQLTSLANEGHPWAIVLLSDGLENTAPYVVDVLPAIAASKTTVHTIGLGAGAHEALMQGIAAQTDGTYHFTPTPDQLKGIYDTISGAVTGQQVLFAESGTVQQGATDQKVVVVDSTVSEATFSISWSNSNATIDLTLRRPDNSLIDPATAAGDLLIDFVSGSTYQYYRVKQPAAGTWTLLTTGGYIPARESTGSEDYSARVTGLSGLTMHTYFDRASYVAGDPVKVAISLSDYLPITGATVVCTIQTPLFPSAALATIPWIDINGESVPQPMALARLEEQMSPQTYTLVLYDDGAHDDGQAADGVYGARLGHTSTDGTYQFECEAHGTSNQGGLFARYESTAVYVAPGNVTLRRVYLPSVLKQHLPYGWTEGSGFSGQTVYGLAVAPDNCSLVYAATDAGVFKSTDGGASWTPTGLNALLAAREVDLLAPPFDAAAPDASTATLVSAITTHPSSGQVVYATAWGGGVYKSTDAGASWAPANNGLGNQYLYSIAVDPTNGQVLYTGGSNAGIFKSVDGGASWSPANIGIAGLEIRALAIDPLAGHVLYAGTLAQGVYKSVDAGASWAPTGVSATGAVWAIAVDPVSSQTLYAGIAGAGVYKSTNGGASWTAVNTGLAHLDLRGLVVDAAAPHQLYAATNGGGVYRATTAGASWQAINAGLGNWTVKSLYYRAGCGIIHAGTASGAWYYHP